MRDHGVILPNTVTNTIQLNLIPGNYLPRGTPGNNIFSNTEDVELTAENIVNIINLFKINKKKSLEY